MFSRLLSPMRVWILFAALFLPLVAADLPVEAQRSGVSARRARAARARRARLVRRRRARARRLRARRTRQRRARIRARREARLAEARASADPDAPADMDFVMEALENEEPPPMVMPDLDAIEAERMEERRQNLDPELFGGAEDDEVPPGQQQSEGPSIELAGDHTPLRARAFARALNRGLTYTAIERGPITNYELPIGPAAGFGLEYYPGAHFTNDAIAHLGLQVGFHHSFAVESAGPGGINYPTTEMSWLVGLRYRVPLGGRASFGAEVAGGQQVFRVERGSLDNDAPLGVPYTEHSFLRAGLGFRSDLGDVGLGFRAAYLPVFHMGAIADELGGGFGHGVEAGVQLLVPIDFGFSFLAELESRVFLLDFDGDPSSPSAAPMAIDRYIGLNAGVEFDVPAASQM